MDTLITDVTKDTAVFINDFDQEFADALQKLSVTLGRPLRGVILLDSEVKSSGRNTPDTSKVFDQIVCDFSDASALHKAVSQIEDRLLLVTCSSERNQPYLQQVLPHMPYIHGPSESSLLWSTHKAKMREMLGSYDATLIPEVYHVQTGSEQEIRRLLSRLTFPLIVKPTGLASSILVSKVHDEDELRATLANGFVVIDEIYARDRGRGKPGFIVEEFINGDMYSVDAYVSADGTVWSLPLLRSKTAYALGREGFYTYQTDSFIELSEHEIAAGQAATAQAIHALGLRSCVAHIELFHTPEGWKIIELGPRAGGQRQDIYFTSYGVDHALNELRIKVGLEPEIPVKPIAYCTTVNFYAEKEGVITAIKGLDEVMSNPSMYELTVYAKPGDKALLSNNGGKLAADGLLHNKDLDQLNKDAAFVRSTLLFVTGDES